MATKKKVNTRAREEETKANFVSVTPCTEKIYASFSFVKEDGESENKLFRIANWLNYEIDGNIGSVGNFAYLDSITLVTVYMLSNEPGVTFVGYVYD